MICENTVASAAPATPISNTPTSNKSPKILITAQQTSTYSGLLESP